ncbi:interleukin-21 isoform X2 [Salarias fasciatus]|uniref:interleukin-21 isoform X2 n=1 Tax=Salarias fasciatus TaxID=181472 RepID=UPI0011768D09|nr:interleukin-21 isoform X2 [Salarias fasciatus]
MNIMKLLFLCLLAALCGAWGTTTTTSNDRIQDLRKLREVLKELRTVNRSLQNSEQMLSIPPQDLEDCCCVSALQCYRDSMKVHLNVTESKQKKLYNSLKHSYTIRSLNFCNSGNTATTVPACDSYPKEKARDFLKRLESLIQRAVSNLTKN